MIQAVAQWLARKWQPNQMDALTQAYVVVFATPEGQRVLQHLMDHVYATVCYSTDPITLATHNGRRAVVQEILENLDRAQWPDKYHPKEAHERSAPPWSEQFRDARGVLDYR